jgi:mRNA interferase MazF
MEVIHQYDIVLVNLEPTVGVEMKKTRPCVVLSPNEMNRFLQTIIIAPITSVSKPYPTRVSIRHKKTRGLIVLDQLRTIDRSRIIDSLERLTAKEIVKVKGVIHEMLVEI